ncbi:MAG: hypothetical protein IJS15_13705, partial [Victivallales bacterium]|nr:hypothetical protein [Victivallales bacterium]
SDAWAKLSCEPPLFAGKDDVATLDDEFRSDLLTAQMTMTDRCFQWPRPLCALGKPREEKHRKGK